MSDLCFQSSFQLRMSRNAVLPTFKGVGVWMRHLYHLIYQKDEVKRRKASYANRDATKVSTRSAPFSELRVVLRDTYF